MKRPWGHYTVLQEEAGFLVKCIVVNPKQKLSLQYHHHREEHWVVLQGEAVVKKGGELIKLNVGQSIDISVKEVHSLQNSSEEVLKVLEIQRGEILDENDIVRIEDNYGRA
jgi:mannose-6-phosphate isomerase-like protein (cupin superfamily)